MAPRSGRGIGAHQSASATLAPPANQSVNGKPSAIALGAGKKSGLRLQPIAVQGTRLYNPASSQHRLAEPGRLMG
jgi:hypothetical protein